MNGDGNRLAAALAALLASAVWAVGRLDGIALPVQANEPEPSMEILRVDARIDRLIPVDARVETAAQGFEWVEGPLWSREGGYLLVSDVARNGVFRWREGEAVSSFLERSGYTGVAPFTGREPGSNGLLFDLQGRLVLCQHGDRRIVRLEPDGTRTILADRYEGLRLNSPNDAVLHSSGDIYFTDPPFGLPATFDDPGKELDFSGVYRRSVTGELTLLTRELDGPNGIAFAPDEGTLYVSNADRRRPVWMAFPVREDGTLGAGRVFFDAREWVRRWPGLPDGMKTDAAGNLFAAGPGGVHVFAPDGSHLGSIITGVATSNVGWGGDDGSDLYITAGSVVHRLRMTTRGAGY